MPNSDETYVTFKQKYINEPLKEEMREKEICTISSEYKKLGPNKKQEINVLVKSKIRHYTLNRSAVYFIPMFLTLFNLLLSNNKGVVSFQFSAGPLDLKSFIINNLGSILFWGVLFATFISSLLIHLRCTKRIKYYEYLEDIISLKSL